MRIRHGLTRACSGSGRAPFLAAGEYASGWQLGVGGNAFVSDAGAELQGLFAGEQDVATTLTAIQEAAEARIELAPGDASAPEASPAA